MKILLFTCMAVINLVVEVYPYDIPTHKQIVVEAGKVWLEMPEEIKNHINDKDKIDRRCKAGYDTGDGIVAGSGDEDNVNNFLFCKGTLSEHTDDGEGLNGFLEHFWDPDFPKKTPFGLDQRPYNCLEIGGLYNLGLPNILEDFFPSCGENFDSAYRLAQDYWDNKVIPFYKQGRKNESYYWLGRVAHLLSDIAVPAHVHLTPHDPVIGAGDLYENFASPSEIRKRNKEELRGQEYRTKCLPNLCDFDWNQVHQNPTNLFKLFWYVAEKTQFWASKSRLRDDFVSIGNGFYVDLEENPHVFNPGLWDNEAIPISNPADLSGRRKIVRQNLVYMANALVPHALKSVAGLYRLFWEETHPPEEPLVFEGLGVDFTASALSSDGSTIVGYIRDKLPPQRAYSVRWTSASGLELLAEATQAVGGSFANAVSADGNIIAGAMFTPESEAFWWTEADGMVGLGDLPGGLNHSSAFGISADGSVIAGNGYASRTEAVRWIKNPSTGLFEINPLNSSAPFFSEAFDVSADGATIVGYNSSDANREATLWRNEKITRLGDLPGGVFDSFARKVSANGLVVVGESQSATAWSAFRWTQSDGMVDLGNLPLGFIAFVSGVSGDGSIIVGTDYSCCPGKYEIFIWDSVNGMRQLADVLISRGVGLAGWTLSRIAGISGDGKTIVGSGMNPNGQDEVWIVRNFKP